MRCEAMTEPSAEQLEELVQQRCFGRVRDLRLRVQGNRLILQGCTPSYYVKQLAQHAVMEVSGLLILANEIEVQ